MSSDDFSTPLQSTYLTCSVDRSKIQVRAYFCQPRIKEHLILKNIIKLFIN